MWISLIVAMWAFMSPCQMEDEHSPDARRRFLMGVIVDPYFWAAVVFVVYSAVVALNSGVANVYDADVSVWRLASPSVPLLPGSVAGSGSGVFAAAVIVLVVYPSVVYSLDSERAVRFASSASLLAAAFAGYSALSGSGFSCGSAVAYGLWAMVAAAVMFTSGRHGSRFGEMLAMLVLAGCLAAAMFSPRPAIASVFAAALLLFAVAYAVIGFKTVRLGGVLRIFVMLFVAFAIAAAVFQGLSGDWSALLPAWSTASDGILNRITFDSWSANPWRGVGSGAFPLAVKFGAVASDWHVLGPFPDFYGNGLRVLIVERGMIGAVALLAAVGTLAYTWFLRARMRGRALFTASVPLFPIALAAVAVSSVFDASVLQADALVAFGSLAALSVNGGT